jgi:hypothetical protein
MIGRLIPKRAFFSLVYSFILTLIVVVVAGGGSGMCPLAVAIE